MTFTSDGLVRALLAERLSTDPSLRTLLPLLGAAPGAGGVAASAPAAGPAAAPDSAEPADQATADPDAALAADRAAAYRGLAGVEAELRRCHALIAQMGASLGACAHCLGTEPGCAYCGGKGGPAAASGDEREETSP